MTDKISPEEYVPIMPMPRCPHCGIEVSLNLRDYGHYKGPITCWKCRNKFNVSYGDNPRSLSGMMGGHGEGGVLLEPPRPVGDPALLEGLTATVVPEAIFRDYAEANRCLEFNVPRPAAVLCRHAIQQSLILKGVPDRPISEMINTAHAKGLLSTMARNSCNAAIFIGGKAAHPQTV